MKPELLSANAITSALANGYWRVSVVDEIDSTQNYLRTSNTKPGDLITAEYQSAGKGRLDRSFIATKSSALLFSIYLEPKVSIEHSGYLTLLAGTSVTKVLNELTNSNAFKCKWPNDILINNHKVAGILAERKGEGVILGIGINVSTSKRDLPVNTATSIYLEFDKLLDRNLLLAAILNELASQLLAWEAGQDMTGDYRIFSATLGKSIRVELPGGSTHEAKAVDIDATGALLLDDGKVITVGDVIHLETKLS
jgi:BirA family biotin operon repressor/biotin-[acetyl-CoA-carboxylase] ligase